MIDFNVVGAAELLARIKAIAETAPVLVGRGMFVAGERIMEEAKAETPVDTGALRSSGHVDLPVVDGTDITVTLGFGGAAVDYAVYVHEDLSAKHDDGKAKYLEDPLTRNEDQLLRWIAEEVQIAEAGR